MNFALMGSTMILIQKSAEAEMDFAIVIEGISHFDLSVRMGRCLILIRFSESLIEPIQNQS